MTKKTSKVNPKMRLRNSMFRRSNPMRLQTLMFKRSNLRMRRPYPRMGRSNPRMRMLYHKMKRPTQKIRRVLRLNHYKGQPLPERKLNKSIIMLKPGLFRNIKITLVVINMRNTKQDPISCKKSFLVSRNQKQALWFLISSSLSVTKKLMNQIRYWIILSYKSTRNPIRIQRWISLVKYSLFRSTKCRFTSNRNLKWKWLIILKTKKESKVIFKDK